MDRQTDKETNEQTNNCIQREKIRTITLILRTNADIVTSDVGDDTLFVIVYYGKLYLFIDIFRGEIIHMINPLDDVRCMQVDSILRKKTFFQNWSKIYKDIVVN